MMTKTLRFALWIIVVGAVFLQAEAVVQADSAVTRDAISEAGLTGGLAVFAGQSNGAGEIELAQRGRWVVLTVVPDEASSQRTRSAVEEEVRRVLVPVRGIALVKTSGQWRSLEKPMPAGWDEWTHFFHGPDGNAVSRDTAVGIPNALRLIAGPRLQDSNGANGHRLSGGIAVSEWNYTQSGGKDRQKLVVEGRDALSGALLWQKIEPVYRGAPRSVKTKPLILADGRLLRMVDDGEESARIGHFDPRSGERVRVYQSSLNLRDGPYQWSAEPQFNYHDGLVVQAAGKDLRCFDAENDEPRWSYETTGGEMFDMFLLDDGTILTYGHQWARIDQATGKLLAFGSTGGNARCDTSTCAANLVTAGFGNYFDISDPQPKWTRRDIARGQCGGRSTPGYGMTYHHGSGCGCFFMIRGNMALQRLPEPLR